MCGTAHWVPPSHRDPAALLDHTPGWPDGVAAKMPGRHRRLHRAPPGEKGVFDTPAQPRITALRFGTATFLCSSSLTGSPFAPSFHPYLQPPFAAASTAVEKAAQPLSQVEGWEAGAWFIESTRPVVVGREPSSSVRPACVLPEAATWSP